MSSRTRSKKNICQSKRHLPAKSCCSLSSMSPGQIQKRRKKSQHKDMLCAEIAEQPAEDEAEDDLQPTRLRHSGTAAQQINQSIQLTPAKSELENDSRTAEVEKTFYCMAVSC